MLTLGALDYLQHKRILITGGTGSLGKKLTRLILAHCPEVSLVILSRDEYKQFEIASSMSPQEQRRVSFFLGDVRDLDRLKRALRGVDFVIHTAALKQVPAAEYNPFEFVKTNILGAQNVITAALDCGVQKVVALSTDKAANPINFYGATKLCSDKLFVSGNSYSGAHGTRFAVVRYGNVVGSRGSVIPFFLARRKDGVLPLTDSRMTRFWITLEQGAALVLNTLRTMRGGELVVPKIPSMKIVDLAAVIAPSCRLEPVGIRPGEKLHEVMIPVDDARQAVGFPTHFVIKPMLPFWTTQWDRDLGGQVCPDGFYYGSDNNTEWVSGDQLASMIASLDLPEAKEWARERGLA